MNSVVADSFRMGEPPDHAYVEYCNARFRDSCLNAHGFLSL